MNILLFAHAGVEHESGAEATAHAASSGSTVAIIIVAVALIGIGAILYFLGKKKK